MMTNSIISSQYGLAQAIEVKSRSQTAGVEPTLHSGARLHILNGGS